MMKGFNRIIKLGLVILLVGKAITACSTEYVITNAQELSALSLQAGDVVIMKNGTWTDQELKFEGSGTETEPILLQAETQGEVILNGNSTLDMGGDYLIVDGLVFEGGALSDGHIIEFRTSSSNAYYSRLTNTKIIDYNPASDATAYKWVSLYGRHNRVDHCEFTGKDNEGALLVVWLDRSDTPEPNYHVIDHNYFGQIPELGRNGMESIRIGTSTYSMQESRSMVEYNLFEECDGEIEIISNKSCFNTYRYNTFRNNDGCLTLRHGNDCDVYGNFFFGSLSKGSGGVRIIGEDHRVFNNYIQDMPTDGFRAAISLSNGVPDSPLNRYFQVKNAQVVNNTIVNCKYPIYIGAGESDELSLPPLNCKIANNVIARYSGEMSGMITYNDTPENMTYFNNMFFGGNLGIIQPGGIDLTDPLLVQSDFYRPAEESPSIGFGSNMFLSFASLDIDGQERDQGSIDAGCDQGSNDDVINKPLSKTDVGTSNPIILINRSKKEAAQSFNIYPNPNKGEFIVNAMNPGSITLFDLNGSLIESFEMSRNQKRIVLPRLPSGIYLIQYQNNESSISRRIMIQYV
ncbi:chondroitinase-B domain-containing protein [Bacteroidota bacterium]